MGLLSSDNVHTIQLCVVRPFSDLAKPRGPQHENSLSADTLRQQETDHRTHCHLCSCCLILQEYLLFTSVPISFYRNYTSSFRPARMPLLP